jgi:hypothetical protein
MQVVVGGAKTAVEEYDANAIWRFRDFEILRGVYEIHGTH